MRREVVLNNLKSRNFPNFDIGHFEKELLVEINACVQSDN